MSNPTNTLTAEKLQFLIAHLGQNKADDLRDQLLALGKELAAVGIGWKDLEPSYSLAATTFGEADVGETLATYGVLVCNILASGLTPEQKATKIEECSAELLRRVKPAAGTGDKAVDAHLLTVVEAATDALVSLTAGGTKESTAEQAGQVVTDLRTAITSVVDRWGRPTPAGHFVMDIVTPVGVASRKYPLGRLSGQLGLTNGEVCAQIAPLQGTRERGMNRMRLYQLMGGSAQDQQRVLEAVVLAAKARGRADSEITAAAKALVPELVGEKAGGYGDPASKFVQALFDQGAVQG